MVIPIYRLNAHTGNKIIIACLTIPCHIPYHAIYHTMPYTIPCHIPYHIHYPIPYTTIPYCTCTIYTTPYYATPYTIPYRSVTLSIFFFVLIRISCTPHGPSAKFLVENGERQNWLQMSCPIAIFNCLIF